MQIADILARAGGLKSIAKELGVSEAQAASGAKALLPAVLGGFKKQAQGSGVDGLGGLLGKLGGSGLLDNVLSPQPTNVNLGNNVLGQIFGSKDISRAVAENAAAQSGLDAGLLQKMLPMLAMLVTGSLAKQPGAAARLSGGGGALGGLGGLVGGLFGGKKGGAGGLASLLDLDGDGNPLDDIMNMVGKGKR